jgi:hypothetical protein
MVPQGDTQSRRSGTHSMPRAAERYGMLPRELIWPDMSSMAALWLI